MDSGVHFNSSIDRDKIEDTSIDSSFSIVGRISSSENVPSLRTSIVNSMQSEEKGNMYEQRIDIKELKAMKEKINTRLQLQKEDIDDIKERIDARRNIDQEIENEIKVLEDLLQKDDGVNALLIQSGKSAIESMKESQKIANVGETTLKRAMEIMQLAIPIFKSVWKQSKNVAEVDENVLSEILKFEEARNEVANAGLDIEKRKLKSKEFKEHICNAIALGEVDMQKLMDKRHRELSAKRLEKCNESQAEISTVVESESGEVDGWLVTCKTDKDQISKFRQEQIDRHEAAEKKHENHIRLTSEKIRQNEEKQKELQRKLELLKEEQEKFEEEKRFQNKVQETAQKLHGEVIEDLTNRFDVLDMIQMKANIAREVVKLMSSCGTILTNSSFEVEKEYLDDLLAKEKLAKERLRDALAQNAVETRIKVENSTKNLDDCKESMRIYKEKWKKAAQAQSELNVKKNKESYEEFKQEMKREKKIKDECEREYEELVKKLEKLDEDLDYLKVPYQDLNEIYEVRMQEYSDINNASAYSSLDSSDEMTDDEEDRFDDAVA